MEYEALSLLPPLVAIILAIATKKVLAPLALGVAVGAFLLAPEDAVWWQPVQGFVVAIYHAIFDTDHFKALTFSLLLGAMVGVLEAGGAMEHLVATISKRIKTRRGAQTMIASSGLAIFFDDYANTLLVGGTMRSTADRYGISRSKLAYLVDSTAAPVAGLSIISTWAATEVLYMTDGLNAAGITETSAGFELFIRSIPYRFYPWLALLMVFLVARSGRDLRPMQSSEVQALEERSKKIRQANDASEEDTEDAEVAGRKDAWIPTVLPVFVCILTVLIVLVYTGMREVGQREEGVALWRYIGMVIGNGNSYDGLIAGGAAGWLTTLIAHATIWTSRSKTLAMGSLRGAWQMIPAMLILWLAWALSAMTGKEALDTGGYLASMLSDSLDPRMLPTIVFVIAGMMAFSTGTSWGTMAILTPLSVTLSLQLTTAAGELGDPSGAICLATSGSVLAGAIFGDHCSPISDTTVLSSRASGCDHVEHVRTQLPYALTVAAVCIVFGCIPAAFGFSPWLSLLLGGCCLWGVLRLFGKESQLAA
ncbi:MAG: Na+/H+ antiporter NhaC family protein [Planctomycetota bacterium]